LHHLIRRTDFFLKVEPGLQKANAQIVLLQECIQASRLFCGLPSWL
jgi:hypothetical protein